jgi:hypothetical protein
MWLKGHNRGTGFLLTLRPYILQCSWELFKVIFAGPHQLEQAQSGVSRRSPQAVSGQELQALADKRYSRQIAGEPMSFAAFPELPATDVTSRVAQSGGG